MIKEKLSLENSRRLYKLVYPTFFGSPSASVCRLEEGADTCYCQDCFSELIKDNIIKSKKSIMFGLSVEQVKQILVKHHQPGDVDEKRIYCDYLNTLSGSGKCVCAFCIADEYYAHDIRAENGGIHWRSELC